MTPCRKIKQNCAYEIKKKILQIHIQRKRKIFFIQKQDNSGELIVLYTGLYLPSVIFALLYF